jgi:hypothetical protein
MRQRIPEGTDARIHARVTQEFKQRLKQAVADRQRSSHHIVTEGEIISELGDYLKPHPDEGAPPPRRGPSTKEGRAEVSAAQRKRWAKTKNSSAA